jgi:hypothetical protein
LLDKVQEINVVVPNNKPMEVGLIAKKGLLCMVCYCRSISGQNINIPRSENPTLSLIWVLWKFETYFVALSPRKLYVGLSSIYVLVIPLFPHFMEGYHVRQLSPFIS